MPPFGKQPKSPANGSQPARRPTPKIDYAIQCIHCPEITDRFRGTLPTPITFWEAQAADRQQILRQTCNVPDPNIRALLTRKMVGQLNKEKALQKDGNARSSDSLHGSARGKKQGGRASKTRPRSAPACGPRHAASRSARKVVRNSASCPAAGAAAGIPSRAARPIERKESTSLPQRDATPKSPTAARPRPKSAPVGGRAGCPQGCSLGQGGRGQWLPHWIDQSAWDAIVAMDQKCPTTAIAGRQDWLGPPQWQCSFERPWNCWMSTATRAGNLNTFGMKPFPDLTPPAG